MAPTCGHWHSLPPASVLLLLGFPLTLKSHPSTLFLRACFSDIAIFHLLSAIILRLYTSSTRLSDGSHTTG